jgi:ABC-type bacteriocin/lantibiotic exporter with double-glycine peptidase domain
MAHVELKNASFRYPDRRRFILNGVSLEAGAGDVIEISGRNGSGKSTLLKLIAGELEPTTGVLQQGAARSLYLDQFAGDMLADSLTLEEHLFAFSHYPDFPLRQERVRSDLKSFLAPFGIGLEGRLRSFAGELSGGERQLLALAIALMADFQILCLDEFTASLDEMSQMAAYEALAAARQSRPLTIFLVSHRPASLKVSKKISLPIEGFAHG